MSATSSAQAVLKSVWGGRGFPVDPILIAQQLGLQVFNAELPNDVSGAIIKKPNRDAAIFINHADSRQRRRFTCAHELGHYIDHLNKQGDIDSYEIVEYRNQLSATGTDPSEVFANRFAANLLMPEAEVRAQHKDGLDLLSLARYFDVSPESMTYRLKSLNLR